MYIQREAKLLITPPSLAAGARGDDCETFNDCFDAYYGLECNETSLCDCRIGFDVDPDDETVCVPSASSVTSL